MRERVGTVIPFTPRKPFTTELRSMTPTRGKRGIREMVDEVVDGKRRRLREGGIPFDPEGVRGKGIVVGLKLGGVLWEVGIGGVVAALEEAGFILAEGSRWLVDEKERARREKMGRLSSTVVAFVRGVGEAEMLLKKGLWLRGRWHSVKRYEAVQPIRTKKGWAWAGEVMSEMLKSEGDALRKVNTSVLGIHRALGEVEKKVDGMNPNVGKGSWREEFEAKRVEKEKWDPKFRSKREAVVEMEVGKRGGVIFTSNIPEKEVGEGWFSTKAEGSSLPQEVAAIATVTPGGSSRRIWATKEEALKALGIDGDWMDEGKSNGREDYE